MTALMVLNMGVVHLVIKDGVVDGASACLRIFGIVVVCVVDRILRD
jgi:hypothetical protein